jgi:hypothetical protein
MAARINTSKSISKALNYNEQKAVKGVAECISASDFIKDKDQLNFYDKLHHFERCISLNERVSVNTLHVSLNFDLSEKINTEKLKAITNRYMERIGFGIFHQFIVVIPAFSIKQRKLTLNLLTKSL